VRTTELDSVEPDTAELVERAREGDVSAFEGLYRKHGDRVMGICMRMARDPELAEEWAQDAWVRAWERLGTFRGDSAFTTWLHRLTVNLILDRKRSDGRWRQRFESVPDYSTVNHAAQGDAPPGMRMDLEKAVATLPDGARTVFLLYDVEGFPHREIADRLGVAEGTVKAQLHRARKLLREVLA
jgi:RNA polymerase sigma-70 factor, ECF subfamily